MKTLGWVAGGALFAGILLLVFASFYVASLCANPGAFCYPVWYYNYVIFFVGLVVILFSMIGFVVFIRKTAKSGTAS